MAIPKQYTEICRIERMERNAIFKWNAIQFQLNAKHNFVESLAEFRINEFQKWFNEYLYIYRMEMDEIIDFIVH